MKTFDQQITFRQGGDSGQADNASIQPYATEPFVPDVSNRPPNNLRARTETLRRALEDLNYLADYDRSLILRADSAFTFSEPSSGQYALTIASGNLWIHPALTPGRQSGGRNEGGRVYCANASASGAWTPYTGTPAVDDLILTAHRQYTGQRGYFDADSLTTTAGGRSLGANRIQVDLIADPAVVGGVGTITATITQAPRTKIRIVYGTLTTATTLANLIAFINADRTSQGAYGVADFLRASSTGTTTNVPVPFTGGEVQGAYDAEAHQITKAQIDAFFAIQDGTGAYINRLREGEGLAIAYPIGLVDRTSVSLNGGRRQALWDLPTDRIGTRSQNTTPASGYLLFSTGREPEKIPGALPIGKVVNGEFVFTDGTRLAAGETLELGESRIIRNALAATTSGADGARRVGYEGSGAWHSDASATSNPNLAAGTVNAALSAIVSQLANSTTNQSASRRIGVEAVTGTPASGNSALSVAAGSLRQAIDKLLNGLDGASQLIGINGRVSELGHRLRGLLPIRKEFGAAGMPSAGAVMTLADLHAASNTLSVTPAGVREEAHMVMQPLAFDDGSGGYLTVDEDIEDGGGGEVLLPISGMSNARFIKVAACFPVASDGLSGTVPLIYAKISGLTGAADAEDGWYTVKSCNTGTNKITLLNLDGTNPDFTGMGPASITFYSGVVTGNDRRHTRFRAYHHSTANAAPLGVIGVGADTQQILDVVVPNGNTGTVTLRVKPKSIAFEGVEMNAAKAGAVQSFTANEVVLMSAIALDFTSPLTVPVDPAGTGRTMIGVFFRITATVVSNAAGLVRYQVQIGRASATQIPLVLTAEWDAAGADEIRIVSAHAFIPLANTTNIIVTRVLNTNTKPAHGSAGITAVEVGRLLGFS